MVVLDVLPTDFSTNCSKKSMDLIRSKNSKFRYVLSDFTDRIVQRWLENKKFERHRKSDVIDFAVFDPLRDNEMQLLDTGKTLSAKDIANPLIVIANYLFDSIEHDAFRIDQVVFRKRGLRFTAASAGLTSTLR